MNFKRRLLRNCKYGIFCHVFWLGFFFFYFLFFFILIIMATVVNALRGAPMTHRHGSISPFPASHLIGPCAHEQVRTMYTLKRGRQTAPTTFIWSWMGVSWTAATSYDMSNNCCTRGKIFVFQIKINKLWCAKVLELLQASCTNVHEWFFEVKATAWMHKWLLQNKKKQTCEDRNFQICNGNAVPNPR